MVYTDGMVTVNVVCGGSSAEREVSLRSGAAVVQALADAGYKVRSLDLATSSMEEIVACDVVFPVLHGAGGEDGIFQVELEAKGAKYIGSDSTASRTCFDKWEYRMLIQKYDLPMALGGLVRIENYTQNPIAKSPYVLKPLNGGSSIDTYIVRIPESAPHAQMLDTFPRYPIMLIEQLVVGTELTVGILGEQALPVIEIIPPENAEFDYENKYNGATQELCPPKHVSDVVQKTAQALALKAHQLTGCRDFSRTDIMCDKDNNLYLLETNTIPGMTDQSLFPKMAAAAGIAMPELGKQLVEMALKR